MRFATHPTRLAIEPYNGFYESCRSVTPCDHWVEKEGSGCILGSQANQLLVLRGPDVFQTLPHLGLWCMRQSILIATDNQVMDAHSA
jgi:hypothetical protein